MLPQIDNSMSNELQTVTIPSKTYKLTDERITGFVDGLESVKQAVFHILSVERYSCLIYDNNYGVELEQYIGKDLYFIEATIEDTLKEALTQDNRINNVIVNNVVQQTSDTVLVDFDVLCTEGIISMEVNLSV